MSCRCGSNRLVIFAGKHDDRASLRILHLGVDTLDGIPRVGFKGFGGDYFEAEVCMDCGTIQNWRVLSDQDIKDELSTE